ncbi:uncharacterized protein KY384_002947 [Bacidia gigantensis]|uniref:uncharacterized protein n=1 Tax=Bacidia gigantensis TaxID=2732470 RepID=UPI001D054916|nr:uncharacterized protein KY384_002947 [Bacidia gigantensis]KAG8531318.1 hypothetical protein KY384_002947 [Bacidia gigantensis]
MKLSLTVFSGLLSLTSLATAISPAGKAFERVGERRPLLERRVPNQPFQNAELQKRASKYLTPETEKFAVNGTAIPDVDFDIGESYAGLLPISSDPNESRKLFFWFFPSTNPAATEEVLIWFNGGPGCSSLSGLLTENGPFTWEAGTKAPVQNPYTWVNLTNSMWVEQPVGVGYSQGVPNITNEVELAQEFIGFYKNFVDTFSAQNYKVYLTGESYGGFYVPYIADAFVNANDKVYYNLAGMAINDPILGDSTDQQQVVIQPFVDYWSNLFFLNETFTAALADKHKSCGFADRLDKYLAYPPPAEPFPVLPDPYADDSLKCDIFDFVYNATLLTNPCFNIYHITETCPHPWSILGIVNPGDYNPPGNMVYFNRSDVQAAINAPPTNWSQCTPTNVFGLASDNQSLSDTSLGPAQDGVLAHVIDSINNTFIGVGNLDFILPTNGSLLALQNMTWGGVKGFQERPVQNTFFVPYHPEYNGGALSSAGDVGSWGSERGLTFYDVQLAGHELPGYAPGAGYRVVEAMLGRVPDIGTVGTFTTQTGGNYGSAEIDALEGSSPVPDRLRHYAKGGVFRHSPR